MCKLSYHVVCLGVAHDGRTANYATCLPPCTMDHQRIDIARVRNCQPSAALAYIPTRRPGVAVHTIRHVPRLSLPCASVHREPSSGEVQRSSALDAPRTPRATPGGANQPGALYTYRAACLDEGAAGLLGAMAKEPVLPTHYATVKPEHEQYEDSLDSKTYKKPVASPLVSGCVYCAVSAAMVLLNKYALSSFNFVCPNTLLFVQCLSSVAFVKGAELAGVWSVEPLRWDIMRVRAAPQPAARPEQCARACGHCALGCAVRPVRVGMRRLSMPVATAC
jgi:hypothetical protein